MTPKSKKSAAPQALEARIKPEYRFGNLIAFSGIEYVKSEWRFVPADFEEEAKRHPYLELRGTSEEESQAAVEPTVKVEAVVHEEPEALTGGRKKSAKGGEAEK